MIVGGEVLVQSIHGANSSWLNIVHRFALRLSIEVLGE